MTHKKVPRRGKSKRPLLTPIDKGQEKQRIRDKGQGTRDKGQGLLLIDMRQGKGTRDTAHIPHLGQRYSANTVFLSVDNGVILQIGLIMTINDNIMFACRLPTLARPYLQGPPGADCPLPSPQTRTGSV